MRLLLGGILSGLLVLSLGLGLTRLVLEGPRLALAEDPDVFEVVIPARALQTPAGQGRNLGQAIGQITASANGAACAWADLSRTESDVLLILGSPGQPASCSQDGALVTFATGSFRLVTVMTLQKGTRQVLSNLGPEPARSGAGNPPATASAAAGTIRTPATGDAGLR